MDKLMGTVFVVDDDPRVLKALAQLLGNSGWDTRTYQSLRAFLAQHDPKLPG
jgi:FixJ family two-component response regulator